MIYAFTSSAPNYVGKVKALFESLRTHCPEFRLHWAVADRRDDELADAVVDLVDEVTFATELEPGREPAWLFQHTLVELATAIKPHAAIDILKRPDCDMVLYFDPDIVVFSSLGDLVEELGRASLVLTPHLLHPQDEMDAILDHELCALRHGVFNLGFLGVNDVEEGWRFLEWWRDRCSAYCSGDWREGIFTDQKWVNFAPVFFPSSSILFSPRFNVAPWNVNHRELVGSFDEGITVGGEPLGFFHFSGFDNGAHQLMVDKYAGANRVPRMLADWYFRHTENLGAGAPKKWKLGTYDDGERIDECHRQIFRERVDLQQAFPSPFEVSDDRLTYREWLRVTGPSEHPRRLSRQPDDSGIDT